MVIIALVSDNRLYSADRYEYISMNYLPFNTTFERYEALN